MSSNRPWIIAAIIFLAVAAGAFIGYSYVASQKMNESAARDGTTASRPPVTTTNPAGTTGSNVPPASR
jgi:hypothetical protein